MKPFPWRPGMRARAILADGSIEPVIGVVVGMMADTLPIVYWPDLNATRAHAGDLHHLDPVRDDGATKGALLDVVREIWNAPLAQVSPWIRWDPVRRVNVVDGWRVCLNDATDRRCPPNERAENEFAALLAAYQEAP